MGDEPSERPVALAATDRPLPVRIAAIQDEARPRGQSAGRPRAGPRGPRPPPAPPRRVRIAAIKDERAPEGMACIGSFLGPRLVARCVLPPDAAAFLLDPGLFAQPGRLALAA